jgi:hypothetical protein
MSMIGPGEAVAPAAPVHCMAKAGPGSSCLTGTLQKRQVMVAAVVMADGTADDTCLTLSSILSTEPAPAIDVLCSCKCYWDI